MDITGVAAVVTGGASGLGAATAAALVRAGARVAIFDVDGDAAMSRAQALGCVAYSVDVTDVDSVEAAICQAEREQGIARVLVNCAGVGTPVRVVEAVDGSGLATFSKIVAINLVGSFNVLSRFAAHLVAADLLAEERGVIINTSSIAAFEGQVGQVAYAASKGGIVSMTLPLARELARHCIRSMTIAPGIFWTPMLGSLSQTVQESLGRQTPFPSRLGHPEEFAQLVQGIIANPMLNGEVIRIDGAVRMAPR